MITKFKTYGKDIIITLPSKVEWSDYEKELDMVENKEGVLNFKVSKFPKDAHVGNKCYITHKGFIKGYMFISGFSEKNFKCEITGEKWIGKFIERIGKFYHTRPQPMKGFQGFRYKDKPLTENLSTCLTLKELYQNERPHHQEAIWNFVGSDDFENFKFPVIFINPVEWYERHLKEAYEYADEEQKKLVESYRKDKTIKDTIIVIEDDILVDGYHRLVALALEGITKVKALNLVGEC